MQLLDRGHDMPTVQELLGHEGMKTSMILPTSSTGPARAPWMICRGESQVCYTETIYHPTPSGADTVKACIRKVYAELSDGVLCRNIATQGCYEEIRLIRSSRTSMAFGDAVPNPLGFVALRQKHGIGEGDEPHRQRRPGPWTVALPQRGLSPEGGLLPSRAGPATRDPPEQTPGGRTEGKWCRFRWNTDRLCFAHHVSGAKREIPGVRGQRPRRPVVALSPSTQKPDEPLLWLRRAPSGVRRRFSASSQ